MRSMEMEEQCSARITWDVLVSSLHFGCRGCILAEGWAALDSARHRGDQRESDRGSEHRLESRAIAEGRQKDLGREVRVENLPRVQVLYSTVGIFFLPAIENSDSVGRACSMYSFVIAGRPSLVSVKQPGFCT